jgi:hypothetical protein
MNNNNDKYFFIPKPTHYPTNKKAPVKRLFEPEVFHLINE